MNRTIDIIDPEGRRRTVIRRRLLAVAIFLAIVILSIPEMRSYRLKWQTLNSARKLALSISAMKTQAITQKTPLEIRLLPPDKVEVYEVADCESKAGAKKVSSLSLNDDAQGVNFVSMEWLNQHPDLGLGDDEKLLQTLCFDPLKGSTELAGEVTQGEIPLGVPEELSAGHFDDLSWVRVEGVNASVFLE